MSSPGEADILRRRFIIGGLTPKCILIALDQALRKAELRVATAVFGALGLGLQIGDQVGPDLLISLDSFGVVADHESLRLAPFVTRTSFTWRLTSAGG